MELVRIARGKRTVIETGDRKKLNARLKQLRSSTTRGVSGRAGKKYSVTYEIVEVSRAE